MDIQNSQIERLVSKHDIFVQIIHDSAKSPNTSMAYPIDGQLKKIQSTRSSSLWKLMKLLKRSKLKTNRKFPMDIFPCFYLGSCFASLSLY
jgi:hypothetical protein